MHLHEAACDQFLQFLARDAVRHEIRNGNRGALLRVDPAAERRTHAAHQVFLLGREALVGRVVEDGADRLQRQELALLEFADASQALEVVTGVEGGIATRLQGLGQQALLHVEVDGLAGEAALAHEVAHAQRGRGFRCAGRPSDRVSCVSAAGLARTAAVGWGLHVE